MRILGLDTATRRASVGLLVDGASVAERSQEDGRHAVSLLPLVQTVLAEAGCAASDLDAVAISAGPGSFTGLRIGLSVAKGLAYATGARLVGVPTLEALAYTVAGEHEVICALLDARKGELYSACFASSPSWRRLTDDRLLTLDTLVPSLPVPCAVLGDAVERYRQELQARAPRLTLLPWAHFGSRGNVVAQLGRARLLAGLGDDLAGFEPFYVRPSDAVRSAN